MRIVFVILLAALFSVTLIGTAQAQQPPAATSKAIREAREVIDSQLKAFLADDAARAYSFAAPGIRQRFDTAEVFMNMVREAYPAVYRPARYQFLQAQATRDRVVQPVTIEDAEGRAWVAVYSLTRQPDSSWRIEACQLSPERGART